MTLSICSPYAILTESTFWSALMQPRRVYLTDWVWVALIAQSHSSNDWIRGARTRAAKRKAICTSKNSPAECTNSAAAGALDCATFALPHANVQWQHTMGDPQASSRKVSKKSLSACSNFIFLYYTSVVCTHKGRRALLLRGAPCFVLLVFAACMINKRRCLLSQSRRQVRFSNGTNLFILSLLAESLTNCCEGLLPGLKQHTTQPW